MALGISRHVFLYVKQMAICYTNRSRYGKRQRSPSEKRSTEHENTHNQYRTVNYCFFFATLFSGFLHNKTQYSYRTESVRQWPTISLTIFSRHFPKWKKRSWESMSNTTQWPLIVCLFACFFGSNVLTHNLFIFLSVCFSHHNIAEKSRNKIHTGSGFSKRNKEKSPLAYVH